MEEQILSELREIRRVLAYFIGTNELPLEEQFSIQALDNMAKEMQKLNRESGRWIKNHELGEYFPGCGDGLGKFIREELKFSDYFTHGGAIYHNKASILKLANELKSRSIDLGMYMQLRKKENQLKEKVEAATLRKSSNKKRK